MAVDRKRPALLSWNTRLLKERENFELKNDLIELANIYSENEVVKDLIENVKSVFKIAPQLLNSKSLNCIKQEEDEVEKNDEISFLKVFFVIIRNFCYYIIVFNRKNPSIEIIDNMKDNIRLKSKYGLVPKRLLNCFYEFLKDIDHPKKEKMKLLEKNIERLQMPWRTKGNNVDYIPEESKENNAQKKSIEKLRNKYATTILLHDLNEEKDKAMAEAYQWATNFTNNERRKMIKEGKLKIIYR
ncbi:hypothetical protein L6452_15546 [Arctium lappa]|uniref:Uncharacterized protein n=1 Tax=Arctium lappa TaxID=4217 RepID=A0ACB9CP34_ARCLA|nr:hypothetical protein L6452_15546 [Arctium lappa]